MNEIGCSHASLLLAPRYNPQAGTVLTGVALWVCLSRNRSVAGTPVVLRTTDRRSPFSTDLRATSEADQL